MYVTWSELFAVYCLVVLLSVLHYCSTVLVARCDPDGEDVVHWVPALAFITMWPALVALILVIVVFVTLDNFDEAFVHWRRSRRAAKGGSGAGHNNQTS